MNSENEIGRDTTKGMLPGIAAICGFLLLVTLLNAFFALQFVTGGSRIGILSICVLLVVGVFGLLRLRRWGWALVLAGCLTLSLGYLFLFTKTHAVSYLMRALIALAFFLYLTRTEVRQRLR